MNKIDRAIYDVELYIKAKEEQIMIASAELKVLKERLKSLEAIKDDKLIPNE